MITINIILFYSNKHNNETRLFLPFKFWFYSLRRSSLIRVNWSCCNYYSYCVDFSGISGWSSTRMTVVEENLFLQVLELCHFATLQWHPLVCRQHQRHFKVCKDCNLHLAYLFIQALRSTQKWWCKFDDDLFMCMHNADSLLEKSITYALFFF